MDYDKIEIGTFIRRVNRFIAEVDIHGKMERVHVKNTGRLKELLKEGATVSLEVSNNPNRKTKYSVVAVNREGMWVNIDSQAPNIVVFDAIKSDQIKELLPLNIFDVKREVKFKNSRFDLSFQGKDTKGLMEVKGVTLKKNDTALFPDAPTERGTKHVYEMIDAVADGYVGVLFFLIQMSGCRIFSANEMMDPSFAKALREAKKIGVRILAYDSIVTEKGLTIGKSADVHI
ncbi:DNA/RNA nuclease SfsA [Fervidibacillus albus]|uniref:Sugar fermentation stimulation protein homolog n=1 Tax=Fervidibacillus albus TaxID=2980026 RepID=A0A9E8LS93_9BACI|nr:DNA/RNA nuclease SfsA [Fervidibacillus albus]WAA08601.1 DNA/RNA nuclease SfsA [Fervidibacillus albus]